MPKIDLSGISPETLSKVLLDKRSTYTPKTIGTSESKYDTGFVIPNKDPYGELYEYKAQQQPWQDKLGNGLVKAGVTAITSATESLVGLPIGLVSAATGGSMYKNGFTDLIDNTNKQFQEWLPNYYTRAEKEGSIISNLGTANFWFDKFANGLGYMAGSIAAGYGLNKFASISKGLALARNEVETLAAMEKGLENYNKTYKLTNAVDFGKNAIIMSVGESSVGARGVMDGIKEKLIAEYMRNNGIQDESMIPKNVLESIEKKAEAGGNAAFVGTLFVTSIENAFMFTKLIGGKYLDDVNKIGELKRTGLTDAVKNEARAVYNTTLKEAQAGGKLLDEAKKLADDAYNNVIKTKGLKLSAVNEKALTDRLQRVGSGIAMEGGQEGAQFAIEKGFTDYYSSKYDPETGAGISDIMGALVEGIEETFGTKEGWESMILGGLLGGPSNLISTRGERADRELRASEVADLVNSDEFYKLSKSIEQLKRYQKASKDQETAASLGDMFEYQNAAFRKSKAFLRQVIQKGGTDILMEQLDAVSGMDKNEFKTLMGYSDKTTTNREVADNINDVKQTVNLLKNQYDSIERQFINPFNKKDNPNDWSKYEEYKHRLWDYSTDLVDLDKRYNNLYKKLQTNPNTALVAQTYESLKQFKKRYNKLSEKEKKEQLKEKNRLVRENKEAVKILKEEYPNIYNDNIDALKDLKRITERRDKVIENYNFLVKPKEAVSEIIKVADTDTPSDKASKKIILNEGRTHEDFKRDIKDAGYDLDNNEDFNVEVNGKIQKVKWNGKTWVINGKPFGEIYNERKGHRIVSKQELETIANERKENIKNNIREKQLNNLISSVSEQREKTLQNIFKLGESKLKALRDADALLSKLQDSKLNPESRQILIDLIDSLQKDIFTLEDSIEKDNAKLSEYDRQIELLEQQLQNAPSIDNVIQDLEVAKAQREYLINQIEETKGLIANLKKIIRDLVSVFNKLFPNFKKDLDKNRHSIREAGIPEAFEIASKNQALNILKNTLSELEQEKAEIDKKIQFLETQVNEYNKELSDLLKTKQDRMPSNQMDNSNQVDVSENDNPETIEELYNENRQLNKAKTSFLTTTGIHMDPKTEMETTIPSDKRWFRALSKLQKPDSKTEYFVRFFTADDPELGKYFSEDDRAFETGIKVMLVDDKGNPILTDESGNISESGEPLFRFINEPSFVYNEELVNKGDILKGIKISHNHLISLYIKEKTGIDINSPSTLTEYQIDGKKMSRQELIIEGAKLGASKLTNFREKVTDDLKQGKKVYSPVTAISSGIPNRLIDNTGNPVRNKIKDVVNKIKSIFIPTTIEKGGQVYKKVTLAGKDGVFLAGTVYVEDDKGNVLPTTNRNLTEEEQDLIIDLLDYSLNTNGGNMNKRIKTHKSNKDQHIFIEKGAADQSIMSKLIYYGPDKIDKKTGQVIKANPRKIYFDGGKIIFGNKSIPTSEIKTSAELKEFLKDLRLNVNKNLLGKAGKYYAPKKVIKNQDGIVELDYDIYPSYEDYLMEKDVISVNVPTKDAAIPQYVQGHIKFSPKTMNSLEEKTEEPSIEQKEETSEDKGNPTIKQLKSGKEFVLTRKTGSGAIQNIGMQFENGSFKITSVKINGETAEPTEGMLGLLNDIFNNTKADDPNALENIYNNPEFVEKINIKFVDSNIVPQDDNTKTPIEGLNERLDSYGNAELVLSSNFFEGERPKGKLNGFKALLSKLRENIVVLADVNWNDFDFFLSKKDIDSLNALKPLAEELDTINTLKISSQDTRTVAVEKRYAALTNQLTNEFVDIIGKHVEQQLGKKITSSKPRTSGVSTDAKADIERIEIPRYFTFNELGGGKGKSGKAMSSVEADRNQEIEENFKKQLKEGDKLIEPNGTITYFKNGKVVKADGSPYGMVDIPAFINGVTIERTKVVSTDAKAEIEAKKAEIQKLEKEKSDLLTETKTSEKSEIDAIRDLLKIGNKFKIDGIDVTVIPYGTNGMMISADGVTPIKGYVFSTKNLNEDELNNLTYILYQNNFKGNKNVPLSTSEIDAKINKAKQELAALEGGVKVDIKSEDEFPDFNFETTTQSNLEAETIESIFDNWKNDDKINSVLKEKNVTLEDLKKEYEDVSNVLSMSEIEFMETFRSTKLNC
jgi:CII-binding regulator of phage lambda lysogenization HflD